MAASQLSLLRAGNTLMEVHKWPWFGFAQVLYDALFECNARFCAAEVTS